MEGGAVDRLEHIGGRSPLGQRLAEFIEQTGVLDRDSRLLGKILNQLDLLVTERTHLRAKDVNRADQLFVLEHRNGEHASIAGELDGVEDEWIAIAVGLRLLDVGDVSDLFGGRDESE